MALKVLFQNNSISNSSPMKKTTFTALLSLGILANSGIGQAATVIFDFNNGTELDASAAAGTVMTRTENSETVSLTTLVNMAPDFNQPDPYATLISLGVGTSINNPAGLGINNPSTNNGDFNTATNAGSDEGNNLNYLESITFEFDQPVTLDSIDLASVGADEFLRITIEGSSTNYDLNDNGITDIFTDPLNGLIIPAGTNITFTGEGGIGTTNLRIDTFTVNVIPEPSGFLLTVLGSGLLAFRRKR